MWGMKYFTFVIFMLVYCPLVMYARRRRITTTEAAEKTQKKTYSFNCYSNRYQFHPRTLSENTPDAISISTESSNMK